MTEAERNKKLDMLLAKEEIKDLVLSYCRAIDRKDFELLATLYHPGAGDEHGCNPSGTAQEFFDILPGMMEVSEVLQHNITNHLVKVDGDYAEGEAYLVAHTLVDMDEHRYAFLMGARYLDRYQRIDGVWKFNHRRVVADWVQHYGVAPSELASAPEIPGMLPGQSGVGDNSYEYFKFFKRGVR